MRAIGAIVRTRKRILLLAALAVVLAGLFIVWISRPTLDEFVGRDLRKLDDDAPKWKQWLGHVAPSKYINSKSRLYRLLDGILPEKYESTKFFGFFGYQPWHLWRYKEDSEPRFILLLVKPLIIVPGESRAAVHFLSSTGNHLGCSDFSTGWRSDVVDAVLRHEAHVKDPIIEIQGSGVFSRSATTRLLYGIADNRVALIRVEDTDGTLRPNFGSGPEPPGRTVEEWEALLWSSEPVPVLEALTWVGSFDREPMTPLIAHFREKTSIHDRIAELSESENQWIREAAILALTKFN